MKLKQLKKLKKTEIQLVYVLIQDYVSLACICYSSSPNLTIWAIFLNVILSHTAVNMIFNVNEDNFLVIL